MAKLPNLMPKLEQAIGLAGSAGLDLDQMRGLFRTYSPAQVNKSANALDKLGRAFKSGKGTNSSNGIRWFCTRELAQAHAEAMAGKLIGVRTYAEQQAVQAKILKERGYTARAPSQRQKRLINNLAVGRKLDEARADFKASNRSDYELTEADRAKIKNIRTPACLGNRCYVDPEQIRGGFAALKPGQYAFEPVSCAALAVAA